MNRSLEGWEQVMNKREQQLWQISLAVVLYRFQKNIITILIWNSHEVQLS